VGFRRAIPTTHTPEKQTGGRKGGKTEIISQGGRWNRGSRPDVAQEGAERLIRLERSAVNADAGIADTGRMGRLKMCFGQGNLSDVLYRHENADTGRARRDTGPGRENANLTLHPSLHFFYAVQKARGDLSFYPFFFRDKSLVP
jgi:hypothetical protein